MADVNVPPAVEKKKSKLSELFKVPATPKRSGKTSQATQSGPSAPIATPSTPPESASNPTSAPSSTTSVMRDTTSQSSSPARRIPCDDPRKVGKGKGKKGASAFIKGSPTQQLIWEAQEKIEVLESFLSLNTVSNYWIPDRPFTNF